MPTLLFFAIFIIQSLCGFDAFAESAGQKLAEVIIDPTLLDQFEYTEHLSTPSFEEGVSIYPNITVTVNPRFGNSAHAVLTNLIIQFNGGVLASASERVGIGGRRLVTVDVSTGIGGQYNQKLSLDARGFVPGVIRGNVTVSAPYIQASNDRPLFNAAVNRIASRMASQMIEMQNPQSLIDHTARTEIHGAAAQTASAINNVFTYAESLLPSRIPKHYVSRFSSEGGDSDGAKISVHDRNSEKKREAPPTFDFDHQAAMQALIHEDLLTDSINRGLAGKEMSIRAFLKHLCGPQGAPALDFCRVKIPKTVETFTVLFDAEKPVEFSFRKGEIRLRLNAVYRKKRAVTKVPKDEPVLKAPENMGIDFESVPYSADIIYRLEKRGAVLKDVSVIAREGGAHSDNDKTDKKGSHDGALGGSARRISDYLYSGVLKAALEPTFRSVFPSEIPFAPRSLPTKVASVNGSRPSLVEGGSLVPMEVKAENGWLATSTLYCSEHMPPLGTTLSSVKTGGGVYLRVESVHHHSPAWHNWIKPGDRIEYFGEPGGHLLRVTEDMKTFFGFIGDRAKEKFHERRTIEIRGTKDGKSFRRIVSLCPKGIDHRGNAEEVLNDLVGS